MTTEFVERWKSGTLSADELDAHYSRVLSEARESISVSAALSDDERQAVTSRLETLKDIVDGGSIGALIEGFAAKGGRPVHVHDDSVATVSVVDDDEEYRRHTEQEARRRGVFAAESAADAAATITDYQGHDDPAVFAVTPETSDQEPDDGSADPAGFAPYENQPIAPPLPPQVPPAEPGSGPAMQYPAAAAVDVGQPLDGSDDFHLGEKKPPPAYVRAPMELAQKAWTRFRRLPTAIQAVAGLLVAILVAVGLFGRGSTPPEAPPNNAGQEIVVNPNGQQPAADTGLVELQPTGGVGSSCDVKGFEAARAFGKNKGDGWVCTRAHGIDSAFMEIDFGHEVTVCSVEFIPGLWLDHAGGTNEWDLHRVVTQVKILVPEGQPQPDPIKITDLSPVSKKQKFPKCFNATRISLIVQATQRPERSTQTVATPQDSDDVDKTFALSALKFMGYDTARR
ncbi:hypothetical protein H7J87_11965 [Mycolicibacterium wolinskyi]|uniref:hypothetical protein n=1 Tax=Mycolicibacterium TaxID=1866885 RepID=UPI00105431FD|nr:MULTISPECIES: hypothetical protein [Mycolicibacterium]MCV7286047.1 hypothetical protein [Mycolicibacterium wolinskyi]MCV7296243.1 hypothetical protein [Mycolicibacterium goodii]